MDFQNLMKIKFCLSLTFEILIIKNLPWGFVKFHKFEPDKFSHFDVYWTQTNKQTDKQSTFIEQDIIQYNIV